MDRRYIALCISTEDESGRWARSDIPFYCLSESKFYPRDKSRDRIQYLCDKWNRCYAQALAKFPNSTHVIHTGSYYLRQTEATNQLIQRYEDLDADVILAGNVWGAFETILSPFITYRTYDTWGFPELEGLSWHFRPPTGLLQVSSVALPMIHPVQSWNEHPFHNPDDHLRNGIWYNQFCREAGLPVFVDLGVRFYRTKFDSDIVFRGRWKELRVVAGKWKRRLLR